MKMALWAGLVAVVAVGGVVAWRSMGAPQQVPVYRLTRTDFVNELTTNGRVEPARWVSARAEREGLVQEVPVENGQSVARGAVLAVLDARDARADLDAAEARMAEAQALITQLEGGGRRREVVEIDEGLRQKKALLGQAEADLATAERLLNRNAGTREEVKQAQDRVELIRLDIAALEARRPTLVAAADLAAARARLREARAAAAVARRRIETAVVRAPQAGKVYQLEARVGTYLSPGALVAQVGQWDTVKVVVYVDEPELGKVKREMPVRITWDGLDGKVWRGKVDKLPTQVAPLGTRQVGEVECRVENPDGDLLPGTNVNAFIETQSRGGVLMAPKEGMRTRNGETGAYVLTGGKVEWRAVKTAGGNVTSVIVEAGLKEGDLLVLGPETGIVVDAPAVAQESARQ